MFNKRKGQSTVEYIVLVTAVLGVAILFLTNSSGPFQTKLNSTMTTVTTQMGDMSGRMVNAQATSTGASPAAPAVTPVLP